MFKVRICAIALLAALAGISVLSCAAASFPAPDLVVAVTPAASGTHTLSNAWPFSVVVRNVGAAPAGATTLEYRISSDAVPTGPDIVISVAVPTLVEGTSFTDPYSGTIGGRGLTYPGTNHLTITVDPLGTLPDNNRSNDSASVVLPIKYNEVVIETYDPAGAGGFGGNATDLYSAGDLATVIASGIPDSDTSYANIDDTAVLDPGDYYVRIHEDLGQGTTDPKAYAIRVLFAPSTDYTGQTNSSWASSNFTGWVPDGTLAAPGTVPTLEPGGFLMRYYPGGGVDWVKVTLP